MFLGVCCRESQSLSQTSLGMQKARKTNQNGKTVSARHVEESWGKHRSVVNCHEILGNLVPLEIKLLDNHRFIVYNFYSSLDRRYEHLVFFDFWLAGWAATRLDIFGGNEEALVTAHLEIGLGGIGEKGLFNFRSAVVRCERYVWNFNSFVNSLWEEWRSSSMIRAFVEV